MGDKITAIQRILMQFTQDEFWSFAKVYLTKTIGQMSHEQVTTRVRNLKEATRMAVSKSKEMHRGMKAPEQTQTTTGTSMNQKLRQFATTKVHQDTTLPAGWISYEQQGTTYYYNRK